MVHVKERAGLSWRAKLPRGQRQEALPSCEARSPISKSKRMVSRGCFTAANASLQLRMLRYSPVEGEVQLLIQQPTKNVGAVDGREQLVGQCAEKVKERLNGGLSIERKWREVGFV